MIWLVLLACIRGPAPPFDADVVIVRDLKAMPPTARYQVDVTVENDTDGARWVLLPKDMDDDTSASISVAQVTLFDHPGVGTIEYQIAAEDGRGWSTWELAPGERRTHRTEVSAGSAEADRLELWLVADVRFPGGPTLASVSTGELAPLDPSIRPTTDQVMHRVLDSWKPPHRGFVVFDQGERREVVMRRP